MDQSKLESSIESTTNVASGFLISWLVWIFVVAPLMNAGHLDAGPAGDAFLITSIFTISSWLRSYFWRRVFANRFHLILHNFIKERFV